MAKNTVTSFGLGNRIPQRAYNPEPECEPTPLNTDTLTNSPVIQSEPVPQVIQPKPVTINSQPGSADDDFFDIDIPEIEKIEHKTKRVQLILKPSVHKKITKYLKARNQSLNDFICQYLEAFIEKKGL